MERADIVANLDRLRTPYPTFELLVARISRKKSGGKEEEGEVEGWASDIRLNCERNGNAEN